MEFSFKEEAGKSKLMHVLRLRLQIHKWINSINIAGVALNANRNNDDVNVNENNPNNHNDNMGFRGWPRVYEFCTDFNQPPSILPISANLDCVWKIFVSFVSANSRIRRSFKLAISSWLLAFIK